MPSPRIAPNTDPGNLGDTVDPWDAWLNGDIDSSDLPPDLAVQARAVASGRVAKHGSTGDKEGRDDDADRR